MSIALSVKTIDLHYGAAQALKGISIECAPSPMFRRIGTVLRSIPARPSSITVFDPQHGPTYRDMVPEPPPAEMAPSCAEAGVLGVLPGIIGSIQAIETIKLLLDLGDPLVGRLLAYDSLEQSFREYKVRKDPANEITYENRDRIVVAELDELCMPHPLAAPTA